MDYLIIGQGLAGTHLAYQLIKAGKKVLIFDDDDEQRTSTPQPLPFGDAGRGLSSSKIAAGIVLPLTGRRIVKTWMADELIPYALNTYTELENLTDTKFYFPIPLLELLTSSKQINDWQQRATDKNISPFIHHFLSSGQLPSGITSTYGAVQLNHCYWLNTGIFLSAMKTFFVDKGVYVNQNILMEEICIDDDVVTYKNHAASKIIFCTGSQHIPAAFNNIPFQFSKGEILTIHCKTLSENAIINSGIFILPTGNHHFRVGATYDWQDLTTTPTLYAKQKLEEQLKAIIPFPYTVINHHAAIRPTIKERKPVIGFHPIQKNMGIINGLGTKGALIAPWLANHFTDNIIHQTKMNEEVNVQRFFK